MYVKMLEEIVLSKTEIGRYDRVMDSQEARKFLEVREGSEALWVLEENRVIIGKGGSNAQKEQER